MPSGMHVHDSIYVRHTLLYCCELLHQIAPSSSSNQQRRHQQGYGKTVFMSNQLHHALVNQVLLLLSNTLFL